MHNTSNAKMRFHAVAALITAAGLSPGLPVHAQAHSTTAESSKEAVVTSHASGAFEVKLNPLDTDDKALGRMSIDKQFHGDLEAVSKGQMLTAGTEVKGSAAYVAIERVSGTLHGRSGSFVLQHNASLNRGAAQQSITVVPDSATGQLQGLAGTMTIRIVDSQHYYDFEYTLAAAH